MALSAVIAAGAVAAASDAIAGRIVVALAVEGAVHAVLASRTSLLTGRSDPSQCAATFAVARVAVSAILASTLFATTRTVAPFRTH